MPDSPWLVTSDSSLAFLFATDPLTYVGRATAKLDASRLTADEKPDHVYVNQCHFVHLQLNAGPTRPNLRFELRKTGGV